MTSIDWAVLLSGVAAIAWVNWYFFLSERKARKARIESRSVENG